MNPPNTPSTSRPPARIVAAAMLMKDNSIVVGIRHFSPDMRAIMRRAYGEKDYHLQVAEQGFVDQYGTFYDRESAWVIAEREGQIREQVSIPGTLYSENLY